MDASQRQSVGGDVRQARKAQGWSQDRLADEAGIAANTVGRIEAGEVVRPGNLRAVLDALNLGAAAAPPAPEVDVTVDLVRKWLMALPEHRRLEAVAGLMTFVVNWPQDSKAQTIGNVGSTD